MAHVNPVVRRERLEDRNYVFDIEVFYDYLDMTLMHRGTGILNEDELSDFIWEQNDAFSAHYYEDDLVRRIVNTYGVFKALKLQYDDFGDIIDWTKTESEHYACMLFNIVREQANPDEIARELQARGLMNANGIFTAFTDYQPSSEEEEEEEDSD